MKHHELREDDPFVVKEDLKQEFIKYIKHYSGIQGIESVKIKKNIDNAINGKELQDDYNELFNFDFNLSLTISFLKHFGNITEGDLK